MLKSPDRSTIVARGRRAALTIVELVIVVLIIGILAASAVPAFHRSLTYHRAEAAAQRIRADLMLARKLAMTSGSKQTVSFAVSSDRYTLPGLEDVDHPSQPYQVHLADSPYAVSLEWAQFGEANDSDVEFNGFGVPDSGGKILIRAGNVGRVVVVDGETGKASIEGSLSWQAEQMSDP